MKQPQQIRCTNDECNVYHGTIDLQMGDTIKPADIYDIPMGLVRPIPGQTIRCQICKSPLRIGNQVITR